MSLYYILDCSRGLCKGFSRHAHFKSFGYAMLTLFRISTGDSWSGIMKVSFLMLFLRTVHVFLIRNHLISNLVLDSLKFKELLELQRKELRNFRKIAN